jgi:hypothetical protein
LGTVGEDRVLCEKNVIIVCVGEAFGNGPVKSGAGNVSWAKCLAVIHFLRL